MSNETSIGKQIKKGLRSCGREARIYPMAKIAKPEALEMGDYSIERPISF